MNKTRFLTLSFLLTFAGFGTAYAGLPALSAGTYKMAIGSKAPCDVTIAADGAVTSAADCATGTPLTKVSASGTGYLLQFASGETFAVVKPHGESFEGVTFAGQHKLVLSH